MKESNVVVEKSFAFSIEIVKFYKEFIYKNYKLESLAKQLLRSGTSIGANVHEAQDASSKKDFANKISIALKESRETEYWLKLFWKTESISSEIYNSLFNRNEELIKLLVSILKSTKASLE